MDFLSLDDYIFDINKNIYNWELTEIIEVTYAYRKIEDGLFFNDTIFSSFLLVKNEIIDKEKLKNILFFNAKNKLKIKINLIRKYIKKIKNLKILKEEDNIIKELLLESLDYTNSALNLALLWLPFEVEKTWIELNISNIDKKNILKKINFYEFKMFWPKISKVEKESIMVYECLMDNYNKFKSKLNILEQSEYESFLNYSLKYLPKNYIYLNRKIIKIEKNIILSKLISREKYVNIFRDVFDLLWLDFEVIVEERSSVYDWEKHLWIPSSKAYKKLSIWRVIELISHEIESHSSNLRNNQKILWSFRWAWNLIKEEWLALLNERLLSWYKLDEINISLHTCRVFMCEILYWKQFYRFMELYWKMEWDNNIEAKFFRFKRNYDLLERWWQRKDSSYWRWLLEVRDYILNKWDIRDLFLGKVAIKDIPKIKRLMELKNISYNDLYLPIFIWELILYIFETEDNNKNSRNKIEFSEQNFILRLKQKYSFINFESFELIVLKYFTKLKILNIISTLKKI